MVIYRIYTERRYQILKVIGINGSARKDGNTAIIMKIVFDELNKQGIETELVQIK
jgi:multimeric flavodoxin WrbA